MTSPMQAMVLDAPGRPLRQAELPVPVPGPGQVLLRVEACGVCRTDLHIADGELLHPKLPLVPGHEIVGRVVGLGDGVPGPSPAPSGAAWSGAEPSGAESRFIAPEVALGQRVGVPWLGWACGACAFCGSGRENLCPTARFTGYHIDGGYAEYAVADARFIAPIPQELDAPHAAPLLCAGLIGYRSLKLTGDAHRLGIYGFGAAAHLVAQVAKWQGREVCAFTRPGDEAGQALARELGAVWADGSDKTPPDPLDAAIIFAPVGSLVPRALAAVRPGGTVVCGGIHMSDIPSFPYALLWGERVLRSVANLTRADAREFMAIAPRVPVTSTVFSYPLERANEALSDLREGRVHGAAVLVP